MIKKKYKIEDYIALQNSLISKLKNELEITKRALSTVLEEKNDYHRAYESERISADNSRAALLKVMELWNSWIPEIMKMIALDAEMKIRFRESQQQRQALYDVITELREKLKEALSLKDIEKASIHLTKIMQMLKAIQEEKVVAK